MKKSLKFLVLLLAALLAFAACDSGGGGSDDTSFGDPNAANNAAAGEFSLDTAKKIFDYKLSANGAAITKLKSVSDLQAYLDSANNAPARAPKKAGEDAGKTLILNKIAGLFIVTIADNAFASEGSDNLASIGVTKVNLSEKLTSIGPASFKGAGITKLEIPPSAKAAIEENNPEIIAQLKENSGASVEEVISTVEHLLATFESLPSALGETLTIESEQVYLEREPEHEPMYFEEFTNAGTLTISNISEGYTGDNIGQITGGKFSAILKEPPALQTFQEYLDGSPEEKEQSFDDTFDRFESLDFSDRTVKYFYLKRFAVSGAEAISWRGVQRADRLSKFEDHTESVGKIETHYIYVENDVTFWGKGGEPYNGTDPDTELDIDIVEQLNTVKDFSIDLKKGWNAIFDIEIWNLEYFPSRLDAESAKGNSIWAIRAGDSRLHWVLEEEHY